MSTEGRLLHLLTVHKLSIKPCVFQIYSNGVEIRSFDEKTQNIRKLFAFQRNMWYNSNGFFIFTRFAWQNKNITTRAISPFWKDWMRYGCAPVCISVRRDKRVSTIYCGRSSIMRSTKRRTDLQIRSTSYCTKTVASP